MIKRTERTAGARKGSAKWIQGYIVREDKMSLTDDEVLSEDDEISFDPSSIEKLPVRKTKVLVQQLDGNGELSSMTYIFGKFPYIGQWWHITVEVNIYHGLMYSNGLPSYKFRCDLSTRSQIFKRLVSIALKENVSSTTQSVESKVFFSFLERQTIVDYSAVYKKKCLVDLVEKCASEQPTQPLTNSILQLRHSLNNSEELAQVNLALDFPLTMSLLPWLQPREAPAIIKHGRTCTRLQLAVEKMIAEKPYELAFTSTIKWRTGCSFPEVKIVNFERAGLWNGMQQPYKDAVKIYSVMKDHCFSVGDTYMTRHRLNGQTPRYKGYTLSHFSQAVEYLKENGSLVEEEGRVYLKLLYNCEVNLANAIHSMLIQPQPFTFHADATCEELQLLSHDPHQRRAVEMISKQPVVVLCGRGGCGKTEVVSRVCRVALDAVYKEKLSEYQTYVRAQARSEMNRRSTLLAKDCVTNPNPGSVTGSSDNTHTPAADSTHTPAADNTHTPTADRTHTSVADNIHTSVADNAHTPTADITHTPAADHTHTPAADSTHTSVADSTHTPAADSTHTSVADNTHTPVADITHTSSTELNNSRCDKVEFNDSVSEDFNASCSDLFEETDESSSEHEFTSLKKLAGSVEGVTSTGGTSSPLVESDSTCVFDEWSDDHPPIPDPTHKSYILLVAPTGKAAKVLGSRTGFTGFTLHQIMFRYMTWKKQLQQTPFPFKEVEILVIDECSLVAVTNLSFLLHILRSEAKLRRVIFLGDLQQLPSIEPGNFLTDVYGALSSRGNAIILHTNHRSEGKLIVDNAVRIGNQCLPQFDCEQNFTMMSLRDQHYLELERDEAVKKLLSTEAFKSDRVSQFVAFRRIDCEVINNICSKLYTGHLCIDPSTKKPLFDVNFKICCTRNGTVGVVIIHDPANEAKDLIVSSPGRLVNSANSKPEAAVSAEGLTVEIEQQRHELKSKEIKDKVSKYIEMVEKQTSKEFFTDGENQLIENLIELDETVHSQREGEKKDTLSRSCHLRLCNGEIFYIKAIFMEQTKKGSKERWIIEGEDGLTLSVFRRELMKECRMKPCWCRTIHTFQGSEVKHLGYVVGAAGRQNWQHVYTAVTRGKSSVTVIGEDDQLRKVINTANPKRFCCLGEKLKEKLGLPVNKANPDVEIRTQKLSTSCWNNKTVRPGGVPTTSWKQKQTSDDELDELLQIEEDLIWGEEEIPDNIQPPQQSTHNPKRRKLIDPLPFTEVHLLSTNKATSVITNSAHSSNDLDLDFSTEDEDEFIATATEPVIPKFNQQAHIDTGDTAQSGRVQVVHCELTSDVTQGGALVVAPVGATKLFPHSQPSGNII